MRPSSMKSLLFLLLLLLAFFLIIDFLPVKKKFNPPPREKKPPIKREESSYFRRLQSKAASGKNYALQNGLSSRFSFLIDMRLPSGQKRFFIYDHQKDTILYAGLVAHGSCRNRFLETPLFSNVPESGCSSLGRFKIGYAYKGSFGKAFKLYGLDSTNSNAFQRLIVLHAYHAVPDEEVHPWPIMNSLGCPMISDSFLKKAAAVIEGEKKPILLWIYR